jgi:hypothetical protein
MSHCAPCGFLHARVLQNDLVEDAVTPILHRDLSRAVREKEKNDNDDMAECEKVEIAKEISR